MKIFVSIASFQDPILPYTIESIIENSKYKKDLVLGIFDQSLDHLDVFKEWGKYGPEIRYKTCDPIDSKGACWARSTIQKDLFEGEDIYMQIDSHMMFSKNWDEDLLEKYDNCFNWFQKPLISCYPRALDVLAGEFFNTDAKYVFRKSLPDKEETQVMTMHKPFAQGYHSYQVAHHIQGQKYFRGFAMAGGFIFVDGQWVKDVPYDPRIYFHGEETTLALRSFTHGYDICHVPNTPLWHWYNSEDMDLKREVHWTFHDTDKELKKKKDDFMANAVEVTNNVLQGKDTEYGLGSERTIEQYADLSGINYRNKSVQMDKALFKEYQHSGLDLDDDFE